MMVKTIENKKCKKCKRIKNISEFQKQGEYYSSRCKLCLSKAKKKYRKSNKKKVSVVRKKYYESHKEEILARNRDYYKNNKEQVRQYQNDYFREKIKDPVYRLRRNVSRLVAHALNSNNSSKCNLSVLKFLPYSIDNLKFHIESQFEPWMTWDNWGSYSKDIWNDGDQTTWTWQIDHIVPQSKLPYALMTEDNFKKCWGLGNLRPLSAKQNVIDGDRNRV